MTDRPLVTEPWRVKIEGGSITVDASSASEARREAIQAFAEDLSLFSVAPVLSETVFQWLIERGQQEGQEPTVWLENSAYHPASHKHWTTDAREAAMFPTREAAEVYIYEEFTHPTRGPSARAVEHGFMAETS